MESSNPIERYAGAWNATLVVSSEWRVVSVMDGDAAAEAVGFPALDEIFLPPKTFLLPPASVVSLFVLLAARLET